MANSFRAMEMGTGCKVGFAMARKIFYARRSKRPFVIAFGLLSLSAVTFFVGFEAGREHPNLFVLQSTAPVVVAER